MKRRLEVTALAASLFVLLPVGCKVWQPDSLVAGIVVPNLPPCPPTSTSHPHMPIDSTLVKYFSAIHWCQWWIPEYNDTQRFDDGLGVYGPVAWSFAAPYLDSYTTDEPFRQGVMVAVAIVYIDSADRAPLSAPYTALGLTKGFTCVYLGTVPGRELIAMTLSSPAKGCASTVPVTTKGTPLATVLREREAKADDVPPVTRFIETSNPLSVTTGIETKDSPMLIGVRCGDAWCSLGNAGTSAALSPAHAKNLIASTTQSVVKGWFDDQHLAVNASNAPMGMAAKLHVSVVPVAGAAAFKKKEFAKGWVHLATVVFPDSVPAKYRFGWGYERGTNEIAIRDSSGTWQARITSTNGVQIRPVLRTPHDGFKVPGTARFVWSDDDELIWVPCDVACCVVERGPLS